VGFSCGGIGLTGDRRQETGDRRQETGDRRQETGDRRQRVKGGVQKVGEINRFFQRGK